MEVQNKEFEEKDLFRMKSMKDYLKEKIIRKIVNEVKNEISTLVPVKNLHHGTDEYSKYLRQWESLEEREAKRCSNYFCKNEVENPALVGAHVIKAGRNADKNWYIVPLCHKCNSDDYKDPICVRKEDLALYKEVKEE